MALDLLGRDSGDLLCQVYSSENKKGGRGQDKKEGQKAKACGRRRQKKVIGVSKATPGGGSSQERCPLGEH